jgi:hypothetical protein
VKGNVTVKNAGGWSPSDRTVDPTLGMNDMTTASMSDEIQSLLTDLGANPRDRLHAQRVVEAVLKMAPLVAPRSVLQEWVMRLGLRHQGTILTAIRGCDNAPKDDPSKRFVRCYREVVLIPHCGDPRKAATFIEKVSDEELIERFHEFRRSTDHYPHHYVMHLVHCIEIVGYKHPVEKVREVWLGFYLALCRALHVNPETEEQLDARLNADEATFAARDSNWCCDGVSPVERAANAVRAGEGPQKVMLDADGKPVELLGSPVLEADHLPTSIGGMSMGTFDRYTSKRED